MLDWLQRFADRQPVLFIVEDLHWIDPSSLELLGLLMGGGFQQSILSILTFRPEFSTPWTSAAHQTQVALNRLTKRQVGQFVREQTGHTNLADDVILKIVDRTDGVPLFVEEFTRVIQEADDLQDVDGSVQLTRTIQLDSIPSSLHDLLISRLDRMDSLHDVVQIGATLGREFSYELIAAVNQLDEPALHEELDKLVQAEVLFEKGIRPESTFIFKHALIQDAAYESLLKKKRQQFHQQIANTLEEHFPETVATQPELLAEHFSQAADTDKALEYWLKAGLRAQEASANVEAISHLEQGLLLVETLPDTPERSGLELQFKLPLCAGLMGVKGYAAPEVLPIQERAIEICRNLNLPSLFGVMEANWSLLLIKSDFDTAYERSHELIAMAKSSQDPGQLAEAYWTMCCTTLYHGEFHAAIEHGNLVKNTWDKDVSAEYAKTTQQNSGPLAMASVGCAEWKAGFPDQGKKTVAAALQLSIDIQDVFTQVIMEWKMGQIAECSRDGAMALEYGQRCVNIAREQSFVWWLAMGICCKGAGLHLLGRHKEAVETLREGMAISRASGAGILFAKYSSFLADALWHEGKRDEAWSILNEGFGYLETGERYFESELNRIRGDFLFDEGHLDQADAHYLSAIEIAQRQGSKSYELRSTMRRCRILINASRHDEAREILTPIYTWFTEGLETPDLIEARQLLEQ